MKLTEKQKLWLRGQADIIVECLPEDMGIRGNVLACGDDAEDRRAEDAVIESLNNGNEWAWCCIQVTLKFKDWSGTDFLGGCSYKSKRDFQEEGGYFPDMVSRAFDELVENIETGMRLHEQTFNELRSVS